MTKGQLSVQNPLVADVRQLIDTARQRVALAVNAELTRLYWQVGRRIGTELLQGQRADYGKQVVAELARQLTADFGKGWSERQLHYCVRIAEIFPDTEILHTLCAQLSWSHLRLLIQIDDPLKRDFYLEICRVEHWSVRQLQERISSLLFERTAISKKPEDTMQMCVVGLAAAALACGQMPGRVFRSRKPCKAAATDVLCVRHSKVAKSILMTGYINSALPIYAIKYIASNARIDCAKAIFHHKLVTTPVTECGRSFLLPLPLGDGRGEGSGSRLHPATLEQRCGHDDREKPASGNNRWPDPVRKQDAT